MPQDQPNNINDSTVQIFISYSHVDEAYREKLDRYLKPLQREGNINIWYDHKIENGTEWEHVIDDNLKKADIILLLISPDFLASEYCIEEKQYAMERHEGKSAKVIPISVRPCAWNVLKNMDFMKLQGLPKNFLPISKWDNQDDAFASIVDGIVTEVDNLINSRALQNNETSSNTSQKNEHNTIFLAKTNKYKRERNNLRSYLIKQGFSILPQARYDNSDNRRLREDIKKSHFFIQLFENDTISQEQCKIAKEEGLPILRWAEKQHEFGSDYPTFIGTNVAAFKSEISHWIAKHKDNPKMQASSNTNLSPHIFIYAIEADRKLAEEVQQQLYDKHYINSSLPLSQELGSSLQEIEESIEQDLLNCHAAIIISDKAPPTWVRQKILHCFKVQAKRYDNDSKDNMNVVAVFNKPPPEGLEAKLGMKRANLHIWDSLEVVDNCISEFKKVCCP